MRIAYFPALLALFALAPGCKSKRASKPEPQASASAAAPAPAAPPGRCREISGGPSLIVGDGGGEAPAGRETEEDDDDQADTLPFATSVGSAVALPGWFAGGGLRTRAGATEAFVALVPADGAPGTLVALERVHGDVDAPLVGGRAAELVVAVPDSDAGGGMLRLSRVELVSKKATHGAQITGVDHDAGAALAVGERGALLVYGAGRAGSSALKASPFDPGHPEALGAAVDLAGTSGAEAPALVVRPGGYFLAFIAERPLADAGAPRDAGDTEQLVALGPRVLMAVPLDAQGKPSGVTRAVSPETGHVVGFDAVALPDGALGVAWREDDAAPGVDAGALELARIGLDGSVQRGRIDDEDISAGLPTLLRDSGPSGRVWVAVRSASEASRVGLLAPSAVAVESLTGDGLLRGAEVLAVADGRLLVSRARRRNVELDVLECKP
ncbi:MAG TPA: hypothetical protein VGK73_16270 [Polyangiaceae bacterium]